MAQRFPNTSNNQAAARFSGPPMRQYGGPNYQVSTESSDPNSCFILLKLDICLTLRIHCISTNLIDILGTAEASWLLATDSNHWAWSKYDSKRTSTAV